MKDGLVDMDNMMESNDDLSSDVGAAPSVGKDSLLEEDGGGTRDLEMMSEDCNDDEETGCMSDDVRSVMSRTDEEKPVCKNDDNLKTSGCTHKRGICMKHKIKGNKMTQKHKRWGKVKHGYGWIYTQTVSYSCPMDNCHGGQTFS